MDTVPADSEKIVQASSDTKRQGTKDLAKTRLCSFGPECKYGADCIFAHSVSELRAAPDLYKTKLCSNFMQGKCTDANCNFAHGEEELKELPNFKKKACKWFRKGTCRNGTKCGFAHGLQELRVEPRSDIASTSKTIAPPPGLSLDDEVPEMESKMPDMEYFRFMAGRGAAPLEEQVKCMSTVLVGLQSKLAQLEGMMVQSQVAQMQQSIEELNQQCWDIQAGLGVKSRLNGKAQPFVPCSEWGSDDSTSVGSD